MREHKPDFLRDGARVFSPSPEIDVSGVERLHKVRVDALKRAPAADDAFHYLRRPGVAHVKVESDAEEDAQTQRVGEAPPSPQADVDAPALETPTAAGLLTVFMALKADQVRLRLVGCDGDGPALQMQGA